MYLNYWQFTEKPFENAINPKFVYYSSHHKEALMRLYYIIKERKGIGVLSGELGSGKTLILQILLNRIIEEGNYRAILISNPALLSFPDFAEEVIYQVEKERIVCDKKTDILRRFEEVLESLYRQGLHLVVLVDEAQMISDRSFFEQLRLLYNYQREGSFLLTLILAGQPELREQIQSMQAFAQRINLSYHLPALSKEELTQYIEHRCRVAGADKNPFDSSSIENIFLHSKGIPRKINLICDYALLQGFHLKKRSIDKEIIEDVISSIEYV